MDPLTVAAVTRYQYQQTLQSGGAAAAIIQALGGAQSLADLEASLLPAASGPADLLDLSPQALETSTRYRAATEAGLGNADVQALLQQATAANNGATTGLLPSAGGSALLGIAANAALAGYQYLQAQQAGLTNAYIDGLAESGGTGAVLLNLLA